MLRHTFFKVLGFTDVDQFALKIGELKDWTLKVMRDWLKGTENFYFNDKNYFDVSEQEKAYAKLIEALQFTSLDTDIETDEILICTSMKLSKFLVNLIVSDKNFLGTRNMSRIYY